MIGRLGPRTTAHINPTDTSTLRTYTCNGSYYRCTKSTNTSHTTVTQCQRTYTFNACWSCYTRTKQPRNINGPTRPGARTNSTCIVHTADEEDSSRRGERQTHDTDGLLEHPHVSTHFIVCHLSKSCFILLIHHISCLHSTPATRSLGLPF